MATNLLSELGLVQVNMNASLTRVARIRVTGNSDKWTRSQTRTSTRVCV